VVLLVAGALNVTRRVPPLPIAAATTDTVFVVRFVFAEAAAQQVFLAGDFNGWSPTATPLERADAAGHFSVAVTLPGGLHEYAFIVDGERWTADPYAVATRDEFGNESSVILVGGAQRGS
jgi:1,4-alpha-glucan branching enzyme